MNFKRKKLLLVKIMVHLDAYVKEGADQLISITKYLVEERII
jgi:hypothetical protein